MIRQHLLLLFLFAIAVVKSADQASDVITLTSDNFDDEVTKNSVFLVEFFAPWCGHCKNLAPEYEKAATELKQEGIHIGAVDADAENNRPLAGRYGIRGFPTLKLFRNGQIDQATDYEGPRTAEGIVSFMKKQTQPSVTELKSVDQATTFSTSDAVVTVGFFDSVDSEEYVSFVQTAEALRNTHTFGAVVGQSDVNEKFGVTQTPALILFKKFDEGKSVYSGDWQNLKAWVGSESLPLIDEIGGHNYKNYVETGIPLGYLFVNLAEKEQYLDILRPVAQKSKGKINWVYIDWAKFARHAERLGLSGTTVPSIAIENTVNGLHYAFDESVDLATEGLTAWVDQFLASTLAPTIKSEPIPEDNNGPVTVVVAKNFEQVVLDDSKDVFVKFYAPWCGHCKAMAPTFEELGQAFQDVNNVVIAKMDATANDVDQSFGIQGFPTLLLFPRGNKSQPVRYEGDRSLEDMKTFVQTHNSAESQSGSAKDEL